MLCMDEQMITFKGMSLLKHYIPIDPHETGYKVFPLVIRKESCMTLH